jgi:integrase
MASGERFVNYLYRFWDWDSDYVQGRLERGKSIGKRYVEDCRTKIKLHIEPHFADTLLCDVTTLSLETFMRSFPRRDVDPSNGYARRTINLIMKTIKKPLKEAVRLGILQKNPADGIELLAADTRECGILTPAELERLFQLDWTDERSKAASILAAVSGMRISEIAALRITDLDVERKIIHVLHSYSSFEKRLKGTKTEKTRIIYTDSSIIQMLADLHRNNPYEDSDGTKYPYIFWGIEPNSPMRIETIEQHLEKTLATLLGEIVSKAITKEWRDLSSILAVKTDIQPDEIIALNSEDVDATQNIIHVRHCYACKNKKLKLLKDYKESSIRLDTSILKRLSALCAKNPYVFIFGGTNLDNQLEFENLEPQETKKIMSLLGAIVRRERNISFHGFRHFFNSTIRGTVSDDILRLQTGHLDEKMTDTYSLDITTGMFINSRFQNPIGIFHGEETFNSERRILTKFPQLLPRRFGFCLPDGKRIRRGRSKRKYHPSFGNFTGNFQGNLPVSRNFDGLFYGHRPMIV